MAALGVQAARGRGSDAALGRPSRGRWRPFGLHQLHLPGQTHGRLEGLRVVNVDGVAERRQESAGEELDALPLVQPARSRQEGLEAVGVLLHGPCAPASCELEQRCGAKGRPEPKVQEFLKSPPGRRAVVLLELRVPELRDVVQVVGRHPHALFRHGSMLAEVRLALVEEKHQISRAVEAGKIPLLMLGRMVRERTLRAVLAAVVERGRGLSPSSAPSRP